MSGKSKIFTAEKTVKDSKHQKNPQDEIFFFITLPMEQKTDKSEFYF